MNENNEFREIDLNQLQKVEYIEYDNGSEKWEVGYFISKTHNTIYPYSVFVEGEGPTLVHKCRPYKEPTKRPMTNREIFNALKKEDCWLRLPENTKNQFCTWNAQWIAEEYEITYDAGETWHKLEVIDD